jgi:hypothetical protein
LSISQNQLSKSGLDLNDQKFAALRPHGTVMFMVRTIAAGGAPDGDVGDAGRPATKVTLQECVGTSVLH